MQVTSFDKSYLHSVRNDEDCDQDETTSFNNLK